MAGFDERFVHKHVFLEGHDFWIREDGLVLDAVGHMVGNITESPCGEYRIFEDDDGEYVNSCHENEWSEEDLVRAGIPTLSGW